MLHAAACPGYSGATPSYTHKPLYTPPTATRGTLASGLPGVLSARTALWAAPAPPTGLSHRKEVLWCCTLRHARATLGRRPLIPINPYTPHQPLLEVHSHPAYPAYYLREPRYGLPQPPLPPSWLPLVPRPDQRGLELDYVRGHVAGLDRRSKTLRPPRWPHS